MELDTLINYVEGAMDALIDAKWHLRTTELNGNDHVLYSPDDDYTCNYDKLNDELFLRKTDILPTTFSKSYCNDLQKQIMDDHKIKMNIYPIHEYIDTRLTQFNNFLDNYKK